LTAAKSRVHRMKAPTIAVSWGELVDRVTILEIKNEKISRAVYRKNDERAALKKAVDAPLQSEIVEEKFYSAYDGSALG